MNLIPIVTFLLLLFAFFSASFLEQETTLFSEKTYFCSYYNQEIQRRNQACIKQFKRAKIKEAPSQPSDKPSSNKPPKKQVRKESNDSQRSKFNLNLLIEYKDDPNYPLLYETAAKMLEELYGHCSFFTPTLAQNLLDFFLEQARKKEKEFSLRNLLTHPLYGPIFYKILQGVNHFELATKVGYPALEDFFYFDPKQKKINFQYATPTLLKSFLGKELFEAILTKEKKKEKGNFLTKKEMDELLEEYDKTHFTSYLSSYQKFLRYGYVEEPLIYLKSKDDQTNITVKGKAKKII